MNETKKTDLYREFCALTVSELEEKLLSAKDGDEKAFFRTLLNLKLQISQSHLVGKALV